MMKSKGWRERYRGFDVENLREQGAYMCGYFASEPMKYIPTVDHFEQLIIPQWHSSELQKYRVDAQIEEERLVKEMVKDNSRDALWVKHQLANWRFGYLIGRLLEKKADTSPGII